MLLQLIHVLSSPLIMHYDQCLSLIGTEREREIERERETERERERESINLVNKKVNTRGLRELKIERRRKRARE